MRPKGCVARDRSLPELRYLIDECCPLPLAVRLRDLGHDVVHVLLEHRGQSDLEQAKRAFETDRVLVTADYDFGELAMKHDQSFVGMVIIAPRSTGLRPFAVELANQIDAMGKTVLDHLTLIEPDRVRRRPLQK